MTDRPRLLFVSPRFLFPVDSGGKIRTTQILRGMKGGAFELLLMSPASPSQVQDYGDELSTVCDEFRCWPASGRDGYKKWLGLRHVLSRLPLTIRLDQSAAATELVERAAREAHVVVYDFLHAAVLMSGALETPSVLFTHNVEAEIVERQSKRAANPLLRAFWRDQHRKMHRYERDSLPRFDVVVAVSDRDAGIFQESYGIGSPFVIPTGVDLEFFEYRPPSLDRQVIFTGSMDWLPNQDAMRFFMDEVWPRVLAHVPDARMKVIGRAPPAELIERARRKGYDWQFTGFVDDIRCEAWGAAAAVVPLRIAGGTRLKVFEAMAMGSPLVSTTIGVEGLPVDDGAHYLNADTADELADAVVALLTDKARRLEIATRARRLVEDRFGFRTAAKVFEAGCIEALNSRRPKLERVEC